MYLAYTESCKYLCCKCDYHFTSVYFDIKRVLLEKTFVVCTHGLLFHVYTNFESLFPELPTNEGLEQYDSCLTRHNSITISIRKFFDP